MNYVKLWARAALFIGITLQACVVTIDNFNTNETFILQQKDESDNDQQHELRELPPGDKTIYGSCDQCAHFRVYQRRNNCWEHTFDVDQMGCGRTKEKFITMSDILAQDLGKNQPLFRISAFSAKDGQAQGENTLQPTPQKRGCSCKH